MNTVGHIRSELCKGFEGRVSQTSITIDAMCLFRGFAVFESDRRIDRNDLGAETIFRPCLGAAVLGELAEGIRVGACDAPLLGDSFGAIEL
jgi:hypothetical protein